MNKIMMVMDLKILLLLSMVFLPKDTDYPLRRAFLLEGKKHTNRWGNQEYDRYSLAKTND
jgi:hypothetical protein